MTKDYSYIIKDVCVTPKTTENVKKAIPVLIKWAQLGGRTRSYNELSKAIGKDNGFTGIGHPLGCIKNIIEDLGKATERKIPTLNALVTSKGTGLPSNGFDYVEGDYSSKSDASKKKDVAKYIHDAVNYKDWDWVLSALRLQPYKPLQSDAEKTILSGKHYGAGGEGDEHKKIKQYIHDHPESIGIKHVAHRSMEHPLLSADRIDVFFELETGEHVAVEVKPSTSPDDDILRGLYQCVKYKAVMDAQDWVHGAKANNRCILVLGGCLNDENKDVMKLLGIKTIENFKID